MKNAERGPAQDEILCSNGCVLDWAMRLVLAHDDDALGTTKWRIAEKGASTTPHTDSGKKRNDHEEDVRPRVLLALGGDTTYVFKAEGSDGWVNCLIKRGTLLVGDFRYNYSGFLRSEAQRITEVVDEGSPHKGTFQERCLCLARAVARRFACALDKSIELPTENNVRGV